MAPNRTKSFQVVLEVVGKRPRWVAARISADLKKTWPQWGGRRVRGEINGFAFRTSLLPVANQGGYMLLVNKKMQAGAGAREGTRVSIRLEPDLDPAPQPVPPELEAVFKGEGQLRRWFRNLTPSHQKGFSQFVDQARGARTRQERAERIAETLMLAMEGETVLPPILRTAFVRRPGAEAGWRAMSPTQRRNHLLGIFYVHNVEGRERRALQAAEDALRVGRRTGARGGEDGEF
jgi:uncharacterized protein YdeI (YjbR/CyaY-like superfamily)